MSIPAIMILLAALTDIVGITTIKLTIISKLVNKLAIRFFIRIPPKKNQVYTNIILPNCFAVNTYLKVKNNFV